MRRCPPRDHPVYLAAPHPHYLGDGEKILNTTSARSGTTRGGLFMPSRPYSVGGYVPILPAHVPPLVRRPMARRRHFCVHGQQSGARLKTKTAVKAVCVPVERFLCPAVSLYSRTIKHRTEARRAPGRAQNNPGPLRNGVSRGFVICSGQGIGRRNAPCQRPTRRSGGHRTREKHPSRYPALAGTVSRA